MVDFIAFGGAWQSFIKDAFACVVIHALDLHNALAESLKAKVDITLLGVLEVADGFDCVIEKVAEEAEEIPLA